MYDIGVDNNNDKDNDDEYHVNDDVWIIIVPGALFCDDYDILIIIVTKHLIIFGCQHTKKKKDIYSIDYDIFIIIMTTNGFVGVYYLND